MFSSEGDFNRKIPGDIRGDIESRMKSREEEMRSRFDRDRENLLRDRRGYDPKATYTDGEIPNDPTQHHLYKHPDDINRVHKDISERHKELIDHRQKVESFSSFFLSVLSFIHSFFLSF